MDYCISRNILVIYRALCNNYFYFFSISLIIYQRMFNLPFVYRSLLRRNTSNLCRPAARIDIDARIYKFYPSFNYPI